MNPTPSTTPDQNARFMGWLAQHVQWLVSWHGPAALSGLLGICLEMGATIGTPDGAPLPASLARFRDAATAARKAYQDATGRGIIVADANMRVNGRPVRS